MEPSPRYTEGTPRGCRSKLRCISFTQHMAHQDPNVADEFRCYWWNKRNWKWITLWITVRNRHCKLWFLLQTIPKKTENVAEFCFVGLCESSPETWSFTRAQSLSLETHGGKQRAELFRGTKEDSPDKAAGRKARPYRRRNVCIQRTKLSLPYRTAFKLLQWLQLFAAWRKRAFRKNYA